MLVSIILPYYKKKKFIGKTVNSVLQQNLKDFEFIIINDEPGIHSNKILYKLKKKDKRIKIINNKNNLGAGLSRNRGIKIAKGKYIAFLDSDDLWKKNKLINQIKLMEKFNYNITHTAYDIIDSKSKKFTTRLSKNLNYKMLLNSCDVGLSTVIVRKKILKKTNLFSNFKTKEDYYLWLELAKLGYVFYYLNISYTKWRITENSLSGSTFQKIFDAYKVYLKCEKNYVISFYRTIVLSLNFIKKKINDYRYR